MSNYFVYILQCEDTTYYTGITTDIERRLKEHNGKIKGGARYTRVRTPVKLIYSEKYESRMTATKREYEIKQLTRAQKRIMIDMDYLQFVQNGIKKSPKKLDPRFDPTRYMGTNHTFLGVTNPEKHNLASAFKKQFPEISFDDLIKLLDRLNSGKTFEEKTIGPFILLKYPKLISQIQPKHIDTWLEQLEGWCEIDTLCQSTFPPKVFLDHWNMWKKALTHWSKDKQISKRRASIVLLCKSTGHSLDPRLSNIAFQNVERLKCEKDILITKAISWILRCMVKNYKEDVASYLDENKDSLPKIAVRETRKKLLTGRK